MKIRTDFVTNSSSSSFVVEIEVELADSSRYVFETKPTDEGANSNFKCSGRDVTETTSINELCDLLQKSMSGTGKSKIKGFVSELKENVEDFSQISHVTLRRIWISYGESSGCTISNDQQLNQLAKKVVKAKGYEQQMAKEELAAYLDSAEVYVEGGWQDEWPTGFCKNQAVPRYNWEYLGISITDLAKRIVAGKINGNDLAVETVMIDLPDKTVTEKAEFIIDSKESGLGKKPACRSNKFFKNVIINEYPEYHVEESVPVMLLNPGYADQADPVDYVLYSNGKPFVAVSIKTAANARSKSFKAIGPALEDMKISYAILDEKKDSAEPKIVSRINEAMFADAFSKYVIGNETEGTEEIPVLESGEGHSVKVKFADNRAYTYNCFGDINIGNIVYVGGAKAGSRGMVVAIIGDKTLEGYQNVIKIVKVKE